MEGGRAMGRLGVKREVHGWVDDRSSEDIAHEKDFVMLNSSRLLIGYSFFSLICEP